MSKSEQNKNPFGLVTLVLFCLLLTCPAWAGTTWLQKQKLLASNGAAGDHFGRSVSISGDYAIVGARYYAGFYFGSAYIFKWNGTSWVEQQKLLAADDDDGDEFGWSVSISGDLAIVGEPTNSGSAYIFKLNGESWIQQAKLLASDGAPSDGFGDSVSISGDLAIVGAEYDDDKGDASGSAYIFKWNGTSWLQQQKLTASDGAAYDFFGTSVSVSGDLAIVGADWGDGNVTNSGSAYIFKCDGETWSQQAKLLASDGAYGDSFGHSVSISGNLAIAGAIWDDDNGTSSGSAYIFRWDGTNWSQEQEILAPDGTADDWYGYSVSISGDLAIVGAPYNDNKRSEPGSAYIFKREGETWVQQQKLLAADGAIGDEFGWSVSTNGDYAIVGACLDDDNGTNSGSAYIFQAVECGTWLTADLNNDCFVDFDDFSIFADQWLKCGDPCDPNCQP